MSAELLLTKDLLLLHHGALAEHYVGQELLSTMPHYERKVLSVPLYMIPELERLVKEKSD